MFLEATLAAGGGSSVVRGTLVLFVRGQQVQALGLLCYFHCQHFHPPESSLERQRRSLLLKQPRLVDWR